MIEFLMLNPLLLLLALFVFFLFYKCVICLYLMRSHLPPGPFPFPLLGNILRARGVKKHAADILTDVLKDYGEPATFFVGNTPIVVISSVETIRKNLIDNPHDFQSRQSSDLNQLFLKGEQDLFNSPYNEMWKLHRKIASRALNRIVNAENLSSSVERTTNEVIQLILTEKGPVELANYTKSIVFDVTVNFCYGKRISLWDDIFQRRLAMRRKQKEIFNSLIMTLYFIPGSIYVFKYFSFYKPVRDLHQFVTSIMDCFNSKLYEENVKSFDPEIEPTNIIGALLHEQHKMKQEGESFEKLKDAHVALLIAEIFEGSIEGTSLALQWFFLEMVLNPEIQEQCQMEIDKVLGKHKIPTLADRKKLPLVEACIVETLRMHPPGPLGGPKKASIRNAVFNDRYVLPDNAWIVINHLQVQNDEKYFDNPKVFHPMRFMTPDGVVKPPAWLPFGCGKRRCLGEQLAKNDLFLIVTNLLQKLKFSKEPGVEYDREPDVDEVNLVPRCQYKFVINIR